MIYDRAHTAEQLAQRYRCLVEHTPDGICVHENGVLVYVNPAFMALLDAPRADELLGQPLTRFIHPESLPLAMSRIADLAVTGATPQPAELTLLRTDGTAVPVETLAVRTVWQEVAAYQMVVHDLTAQRAAEAAQHRAEQFFTTVVSQLEEAVAVIDQAGRIVSINPAALRIFGLDDHSTPLGQAITALPLTLWDSNTAPLPPEQHPVARTLATGETITGFVFGIDRPDGRRRWLSGSSRLLTPDDPQSPVVSSFADVTEFRAHRRRLEYQATHDSLTGVANRSLILSQLTTALTEPDTRLVCGVMFIDLDGFKTINDTLGHVLGDTVLRIVAQRLQRALRAEDLVGRLGGDEFLVLLSGDARPDQLAPLVERLHTCLTAPIIAQGHHLAVDASIGVTPLHPDDPRTPEKVLHDADLAMYRAKPHHRDLDQAMFSPFETLTQ